MVKKVILFIDTLFENRKIREIHKLKYRKITNIRITFLCVGKSFPMKIKDTFKELSKPITYDIDGRKFIVEPVFKEKSTETMGEILLKIIIDKEISN